MPNSIIVCNVYDGSREKKKNKKQRERARGNMRVIFGGHGNWKESESKLFTLSVSLSTVMCSLYPCFFLFTTGA